MSFRHTHITQFLYWDHEDPKDIADFITGLKGGFDEVHPNWSDLGRINWIVLYGRDLNNYDEELDLPLRFASLEGILKSDVEVVSAWESENEKPRQRLWTIKGRGDMSVVDYLEAKAKS